MSDQPREDQPINPWAAPGRDQAGEEAGGYVGDPAGQPPPQSDPYPPVPQPHQGGYGIYTFPAVPTPPIEPTAVISLATSLIPPVGFGFGIAALRRIKRNAKRGKRLAGLGIAASILLFLVSSLVVATLALDGTFARMMEEPMVGDYTSETRIAPVNLAQGNCVQTLPVSSQVGEVVALPCNEPHQLQVLDRVAIEGDTYPAPDALVEQATQECSAIFESLSPPVEDWPDGFIPKTLMPSEQNWHDGDRTIICLAQSVQGSVTESLVQK